MSWNFLHLRSKYQNVELMKRLKLFLSNVQAADGEPSLELTQAMLNPPEILKDPRIKEPLFKELTLSPPPLVATNTTNSVVGGLASSSRLIVIDPSFNLDERFVYNNEAAAAANSLTTTTATTTTTSGEYTSRGGSFAAINNLYFELNTSLSKMVEKDFFLQFSNAWKYLTFVKFSKSVQNRFFCSHSLKVKFFINSKTVI